MRGARLSLILSLLSATACSPSSGEVDLVGASGVVQRRFTQVEHAATPDTRARGLTGHAPLGADDAMVLDYPLVDQACITNEAVSFPITVIFADAKGAIVGVESLAGGDTRVPCHDGVLTVVEVDANAIVAAKLSTAVVVR